MDLKEAASLIDGREYRDELPDGLLEQLKESGIVLFTGRSDDLMYAYGAINQEFYGTAYFRDCEPFELTEPFEEMDELFRWLDDVGVIMNFAQVDWQWDNGHKITSRVRHEKVNIIDDGEVYSESILVLKEDLWDE